MSTFKLSFFWGSLHAVFTDTIYSHPTGDGNLHVPANGTTNNGKVLTAGSIAGSYTWETPAQGVTDHTLLSNIGTNTHTAIDSHIADNTKHFTQAEIAITESQISDFGSYALAADVLTPVPLGAVFTDTVYDDTAIQAEVSLNTADRHTHTNKTVIDNTTASYTTTEQTKLSGIEEGANNYTLPFTDNSANWNTAYSWGNHAGLYEPADSTILKDADLGLTVQPYNSNTTLQGVVTLASLGFTGDTDANNYIHPATHSISEVSGLQTTLDSKVDNSQVLTNVPNDAVFTDTVYDDTAIQAAVALNTAKVGISIEQAQAIEANTAKNSYPSADAAKLSGIEEGATADQTKADIDALGIDAVTVNGYTVDSNVPSGAVFTDTVYNDTAIQAEVDLNTAKLSATGNELEATDINTLAKVNTIITDAILIDTNDSRLTDTRTPIDNSVTPAKLSSHFTDIETVSVTALDWSNLGGTKTLSTDTTFTFSNLRAGVYFLITTGDYSPTFPTGFTYVGGTRAATGTTYYQIVCVDSTTPEGVYTILKNES